MIRENIRENADRSRAGDGPIVVLEEGRGYWRRALLADCLLDGDGLRLTSSVWRALRFEPTGEVYYGAPVYRTATPAIGSLDQAVSSKLTLPDGWHKGPR